MGEILQERKFEMKRYCCNVTAVLLAVAIFGGLLTPLSAGAAENTDARIDRLEAALIALQAELAELKAERSVNSHDNDEHSAAVTQKKIDAMVDKAISRKNNELGVAPQWVQNIKLFGDFRYRHEQIHDTGQSNSTAGVQRDRNRIRARIGLKAKINDEFDTVFRIGTGSSDTPVSTNQTLGDSGSDSFSSKEIWLDWAYFDWHPDSTPGLNVYGGKMKQPFYSVGKNELVWDGDISPEGVVAKYTFDIDQSNTATINGGGLWLRERSGDADSSFWGLQGMVKHDFGNDTHLLGGTSYYNLGNVEDHTLNGVSLNGNTNDGSGGYKYDFNIVEGFAEYGFPIMDMPSAVFGSYLENTAAPSGRNNAFWLGGRLNKISSKPGSWQFAYSYREVDPDAVFAGLTDSDILLGGTGGKGHELGFQYQLQKNVQTNLSYFISERNDRSGQEGGDIHLLHADLIFKF